MSDGRLMPSDAGVTLLETLIVLAILGVAVGAAMLALPSGDDDPTTRREAALLEARLEQAADDSLSRLAPARMTWTTSGYRFEEWRDGAWAAHATPVLAQAHDLPQGIRLTDEGSVAFSPEVLPPEDGTVALTLTGRLPVTLRFDGFAATIDEAAP